MSKIRIVIADDHKLIRDGITTLLRMDEQFEVIGVANDGLELITLLENCLPDVVLVDITMPNMNGIEAVARLKKINPNLRFIILTMHEEGDYVMKSIKSGANGYLLKNSDFEELQKAIKTVVAGGKYYNSVISNLMIENMSNPNLPKGEKPDLTVREIEVLKEVAEGLSTKMIAEKLSISSRTVETHRVNMMKKMVAHNTAELIKKALEWKII